MYEKFYDRPFRSYVYSKCKYVTFLREAYGDDRNMKVSHISLKHLNHETKGLQRVEPKLTPDKLLRLKTELEEAEVDPYIKKWQQRTDEFLEEERQKRNKLL